MGPLGSNVLLLGPPGTGKSMLASRLMQLLPPLNYDEALEVATLHSVAGQSIETKRKKEGTGKRGDRHIFCALERPLLTFKLPQLSLFRIATMTSARRTLIDPESTPFYHIINRCVRRAFLCGEDKLTGKSFEHRRGWIVEKIMALSAIFCIDVCAYAVMNNHYHLVLKIDLERANSLSNSEIIELWCKVTKGHDVATKYINGDTLIEGERLLLDGLLAEWHERLSSISWFMKCLNEEIARRANREDGCKGAFWEGRFKSQALLDEQALLACMMYVDLNPIRAGIANTLQTSDFTSIQERITELSTSDKNTKSNDDKSASASSGPLKPLAQFDGAVHLATQSGIPFHFCDYLQLIDWTGRAIRPDKKGFIDSTQPKLLNELGITPEAWITSAKEFRRQYSGISGRWDAMCAFKKQHNCGIWCKGKASSNALHPAP